MAYSQPSAEQPGLSSAQRAQLRAAVMNALPSQLDEIERLNLLEALYEQARTNSSALQHRPGSQHWATAFAHYLSSLSDEELETGINLINTTLPVTHSSGSFDDVNGHLVIAQHHMLAARALRRSGESAQAVLILEPRPSISTTNELNKVPWLTGTTGRTSSGPSGSARQSRAPPFPGRLNSTQVSQPASSIQPIQWSSFGTDVGGASSSQRPIPSTTRPSRDRPSPKAPQRPRSLSTPVASPRIQLPLPDRPHLNNPLGLEDYLLSLRRLLRQGIITCMQARHAILGLADHNQREAVLLIDNYIHLLRSSLPDEVDYSDQEEMANRRLLSQLEAGLPWMQEVLAGRHQERPGDRNARLPPGQRRLRGDLPIPSTGTTSSSYGPEGSRIQEAAPLQSGEVDHSDYIYEDNHFWIHYNTWRFQHQFTLSHSVINGRVVDLSDLFYRVLLRGGSSRVRERDDWHWIATDLDLAPRPGQSIVQHSAELAALYRVFLADFERWWYENVRQECNGKPHRRSPLLHP